MPADPVDPRLVEGVALYHAQRFFECHEVLEALWKDTDGRLKDFYKGLIQAAVACHHWSKGNLAGALTLARSASGYLKRYGPVCCGLEAGDYQRRFAELFAWLRRHPQRFDPRLVPPLRWSSGVRHAGTVQ